MIGFIAKIKDGLHNLKIVCIDRAYNNLVEERAVAAVAAERIHQQDKHPIDARYALNPLVDPTRTMLANALHYCKDENDNMEKRGEVSWYELIREENLESFAESDIDKAIEEQTQATALNLRYLVWLMKMKDKGVKTLGGV